MPDVIDVQTAKMVMELEALKARGAKRVDENGATSDPTGGTVEVVDPLGDILPGLGSRVRNPLNGRMEPGLGIGDTTNGQAGTTPHLKAALQVAEEISDRTEATLSEAMAISDSASGGRTAKGQFKKGVTLPSVHLAAKKAAKHRAILLTTISTEDVQEVTMALMLKAKAGHLPAIVEFFNRAVGKPLESDVLERLALLEVQATAAANGQEVIQETPEASPIGQEAMATGATEVAAESQSGAAS